ncbi:MAG: exodeoxyribonuclease VII small subunit [Wenzhouxiangella sp.]
MTDTTPKKAARKKDSAPAMDFEQALNALEGVVEKLESGELGLADSLKEFEQGIQLSRQCHEMLDQARQSVEILIDGQARPFDESDDDKAP